MHVTYRRPIGATSEFTKNALVLETRNQLCVHGACNIRKLGMLSGIRLFALVTDRPKLITWLRTCSITAKEHVIKLFAQ